MVQKHTGTECLLVLTWVLWWVRCTLSSTGKFLPTSKLMTTGQSVNPHAFTPRPKASRSMRQLGEMNQCPARQTPLSLSMPTLSPLPFSFFFSSDISSLFAHVSNKSENNLSAHLFLWAPLGRLAVSIKSCGNWLLKH